MDMLHVGRTLGALLLAVLSTASAQDKPIVNSAPGATLKGTVRDRKGKVLEDVAIVVQRWTLDWRKGFIAEFPVLARTDRHGRFSVRLGPGSYDVLVSAPMHFPLATQVQMVEWTDTELNPKLGFIPLEL